MLTPNIGIVGAGIAGLHLGLMLQQNGIDTTLYADKSPEQMRAGRLMNNVCRFGRTRRREAALGVNYWDLPDWAMGCAHVRVHTDPPAAFCGKLTDPGSFVDFRIYLPRLLEDYADRGGNVVTGRTTGDGLVKIAQRHDLLIVASGGRLPAQVFPIRPERSQSSPKRLLLAGLFQGIAQPEPVGLHFDIVPGSGEIFQSPVLSLAGRVSGITFEAIPDGNWVPLLEARCDEDPQHWRDVILALLRESGSEILDRVDLTRFQLTRPLDVLQGSITPTVRQPWARLGEGLYTVALGDAAILNDPVTGQGANLAVAAAWALGEAILAGGPLNERFCSDWDRRLWELARDVTAWTNASLDPLPSHVTELFYAAGSDQSIADNLIDNFDDPRAMWRSVENPQSAADFIARHRTRLATEAGPKALHEVLVDYEQRFLSAMFTRMPTEISDLLDSDMVVVGEEGIGGAETLNGSMDDWSSAPVMSEIHTLAVSPETAIISYSLDRSGRSDSAPGSRVYCSSIWSRKPSGWRMICRQESPTVISVNPDTTAAAQ